MSETSLDIVIATQADKAALTSYRAALEELKRQAVAMGVATGDLDKQIAGFDSSIAKLGKQSVPDAAEGVSVFNTHGREMVRLFGEMDRVAPGTGELLRAVFRPESLGIAGALLLIELVIGHFKELDKEMEAAAERAADPTFADGIEAKRKAILSLRDAMDDYTTSLDNAISKETELQEAIEKTGRLRDAQETATGKVRASEKKAQEAEIDRRVKTGELTESQGEAAKEKLEEQARSEAAQAAHGQHAGQLGDIQDQINAAEGFQRGAQKRVKDAEAAAELSKGDKARDAADATKLEARQKQMDKDASDAADDAQDFRDSVTRGALPQNYNQAQLEHAAKNGDADAQIYLQKKAAADELGRQAQQNADLAKTLKGRSEVHDETEPELNRAKDELKKVQEDIRKFKADLDEKRQLFGIEEQGTAGENANLDQAGRSRLAGEEAGELSRIGGTKQGQDVERGAAIQRALDSHKAITEADHDFYTQLIQQLITGAPNKQDAQEKVIAMISEVAHHGIDVDRKLADLEKLIYSLHKSGLNR